MIKMKLLSVAKKKNVIDCLKRINNANYSDLVSFKTENNIYFHLAIIHVKK